MSGYQYKLEEVVYIFDIAFAIFPFQPFFASDNWIIEDMVNAFEMPRQMASYMVLRGASVSHMLKTHYCKGVVQQPHKEHLKDFPREMQLKNKM